MSDNRPEVRPRDRRRVRPAARVAVAAALSTGLLIAAHSAQQQARARETAEITVPAPSVRRSGPGPVLPESVPVPPADTHATGERTAKVGVANGPITVSYLFDGGARQPVVDSSAGHPMTPDTANGGEIRYTARDGGWAVRFPDRCTTGQRCPRAILSGVRDDALNPGVRPFRFGAAIRMTKADTGPGANVLQKGYSVGGVTQFKLQVDGAPGRPSCVIAGRTRIYKVVGPRSVADGTWHSVVCDRAGDTLSMTVDGLDAGSAPLPASLSIANPEPLRVGGKGTTANNDQYAGEIDNVFVSIL